MSKILLFSLLLSLLHAFFIYEASIINLSQVRDVPWPFTDCSKGQGKWEIESLTLGQLPARNIVDDITISGTAKEATNFKTVELDVKLNGVYLHNQTIPFENVYDQDDTVRFQFKNEIPGFAPPGTYGLTFQFKTKAGANNGCLYFSFKL